MSASVYLVAARQAIDWLALVRPDQASAIRDVTLMRLRALLARAHGDDVGFRDLVNRYRHLAHRHGFDGHIDWSEAMLP